MKRDAQPQSAIMGESIWFYVGGFFPLFLLLTTRNMPHLLTAEIHSAGKLAEKTEKWWGRKSSDVALM